MREYQEKKRIRKIIYSHLSFAALFAIMGFLGYSTIKIYMGASGAEIRTAEIRKNLSDLEARKEELEKEIARMESESGLEEELRKRFNVAKPGEQAVLVVDKKRENDKIADTAEEESFFLKIWRSIKNRF